MSRYTLPSVIISLAPLSLPIASSPTGLIRAIVSLSIANTLYSIILWARSSMKTNRLPTVECNSFNHVPMFRFFIAAIETATLSYHTHVFIYYSLWMSTLLSEAGKETKWRDKCGVRLKILQFTRYNVSKPSFRILLPWSLVLRRAGAGLKSSSSLQDEKKSRIP